MYDTLTDADREAITDRIQKPGYKPLISVLMPVYNVDEEWLRLAVESVCKQLCPHWELCIADDKSDKPHVRRMTAGTPKNYCASSRPFYHPQTLASSSQMLS